MYKLSDRQFAKKKIFQGRTRCTQLILREVCVLLFVVLSLAAPAKGPTRDTEKSVRKKADSGVTRLLSNSRLRASSVASKVAIVVCFSRFYTVSSRHSFRHRQQRRRAGRGASITLSLHSQSSCCIGRKERRRTNCKACRVHFMKPGLAFPELTTAKMPPLTLTAYETQGVELLLCDLFSFVLIG